MSYLLKPANGTFLSPNEVIERLRREFAVVRTDRDAGANYVGDLIVGLTRLGLSGPPVDSLVEVRDSACKVYVADGPDATDEFLDVMLVPNRPVRVAVYDQERMQPMLTRCARVLGCNIEW